MTTHHDADEQVEMAVRSLMRNYAAYLTALGKVVAIGDRAVPLLIKELDHKQANPMAKALGLLMDRPESEEAIPRLLDWVVAQAPVRQDALEALLRAGDKVVPQLLDRLKRSAREEDDEAVRHLLDLGVQLPEHALGPIVKEVLVLLKHPNPHLREAAADAVWRLGLPHGAAAAESLRELSEADREAAVRSAAAEALRRLGLDKPASDSQPAKVVRVP